MTKLQITGFNFERELPLLIFYIILKENTNVCRINKDYEENFSITCIYSKYF